MGSKVIIDYEPSTEEGVYRLIQEVLRDEFPKAIWFFDLSGIPLWEGLKKKMARYRSGRGIPDLIILEPRSMDGILYSGMLLEIKRASEHPFTKKGELKKSEHLEAQAAMLEELRKRGFHAEFGVGAIDCIKKIRKYLG